MPNPVAVMRADQEHWSSAPFLTSSRGNPPPLTSTNFTVQDDGNCSPRFIRSTMYTVPCSKDLLNGCRVPLGLITQPLASVPPAENTLHLVDHGASGPIRCNRCKAYMNPFARFIDGGRQYYCPICQCSNEVPQEYFCYLDHNGRRTDTMQRPELRFGSVEFVATKDYCKDNKLPKPPAYIFLLDVSLAAAQSGLINLFCESILSLLDQLPGTSEETGSPIKVGFVTYDKTIQFYNVKESLAQPQMMVLTDVSEVFVPMVDGFLVDFSEARSVVENLVSQLPAVLSAGGQTPSPQVLLEPAVRAGMEALRSASCSGRLFVFHSSLPTAPAPGQLKQREDAKLLGTDKEKSLLSPAGSVYQQLAEECVKQGVGVELFLVSRSYCDVATLAHFASTTGGELHLYKDLQINGLVSQRDGGRLVADLKHSLTRNTGFDGVMRVRASSGLRPTGFFGAFHMSTTTDIELGNIDCDKAVTVEIKHDDKLKEDDIAFFQCALLYTDWCGQRRLRVHNLALNCSTKYQDLYRSCEIDTITAFFSKSIAKASLTMSYKSIREAFIHQCAVVLACYRKQCSQQSPPGQLILPENLKLLPMYANCLLKSDALLSPPIVSLDEKCWLLYSLLATPTSQTGAFFYPRMYSLHDVDVGGKGLPPVMRCTGQKLQDNGVYLVENGFYAVVWVGHQASAEFVSQVFGDHSPAQVNTDVRNLLSFDNPLSVRVRAILAEIQSTKQHTLKLVVVKQKDKSEVAFRRLLKEDKGAGPWEGSSYIDFLLQVHREIKEILS